MFFTCLYLVNQLSGNRETANKSVKPNKIMALKELFGLTDPSGTVKPSQDKLASIWFDQMFRDGNDSTYVVFVKEQSLDENGELINCNECNAIIDAVTYKLISGSWRVVSKQKNITEIGNWGDAPKIDQAKILQLSPENTALLVRTEWVGQGNIAGGYGMFAYHVNTWSYLGYLDVFGSNEGSGCDKSHINEQSNKNEKFCWLYSGKVYIQQSDKSPYPNIIVNRTGTTFDESAGRVVSAGKSIFTFNGKEYVDLKYMTKNKFDDTN